MYKAMKSFICRGCKNPVTGKDVQVYILVTMQIWSQQISFINLGDMHRRETWPVIKENEVALQRADMRMVRWMCGIKLQDRVPSKGLRERLGLDDISVLHQNRLQWYGHVLQKEDNDWVKKCIECELDGARPRGTPKKTRTEIMEKDCQARKLNREEAVDRNRWRKQIRDD